MVLKSCFRNDNDSFDSCLRVRHPEHGNAAFAHIFDLTDRFFDFVRVDIAARTDDDVLRASGDMDLAVREIAAVSAFEPTIAYQFAGLFFVVKIPAGRRRSAKLNPPHAAFAQFAAGVIQDPNVVARQGPAAGDHFQHALIRRACRNGFTTCRHQTTANPVDRWQKFWRRCCESQRVLGHPVYRSDRFRPKTVGLEPFRELAHRVPAYRFGAVHQNPCGTQIQALNLIVFDLGGADLERKIRCRRDRSSVLMNRPQPSFRPRQKRQWRHQNEWHGIVETAQPSANQSHVVVKRQPTDNGISRARMHDFTDGAKIREQIAMTQHDTFRVSGAA